MSVNNLVIDGSFEEGEWLHWTTNNAIITSEYVSTGTYSALLPRNTVDCFLVQKIPVRPGVKYELCFKAAIVASEANFPLTVRFKYFDQSNLFLKDGLISMIEYQQLPNVTNEKWLQVHQVTATAPLYAETAQLIFEKPVSQSVIYIDDIVLTAIEEVEMLRSIGSFEADEVLGATADVGVTVVDVGPSVSSQFGELMVSERTPIFELTSVYGLSNLRDIVTTTGNGTVSNNGTEFIVSTATTATDSATLDSIERGRYEPGYASNAGIGIRLPSAPIGTQVVQWGFFDDLNGAFFGQSVLNGIFVALRRNGVDTIVPQASWNVDPLNGSGPSGATLNLAKGNIFEIVFTWYGYGVIEYRVVIPDPVTLAQEVITVHRISPSNQTSFADPDLPLRAQVFNNGTLVNLNLFVGGRQFSIIGRFRPTRRITSDLRSELTITSAPFPIISFQRKPVFPAGSGRVNSVNVTLEGLDLITSQDIAFQIILSGTLNGAFVNFPTATTNIPTNETALLVNNTSTTITGGEVVMQGIVAGTKGSGRIEASADLLSLQLPGLDAITLTVSSISGANANVSAVFRVVENW